MAEIEHVIFVTDHAYINGGVAKVATDEAKGIAKTGRRVTFFAPCGPPDPTLAEAGVEVVCLNQPDIADDSERFSAMRRGIWNRTAARELSSLLKDTDPGTSIVHAHSFSRALSPAIGPVLTSGRVPHVYTMHEYFLACPNGGFYDYQKKEICRRKALGMSCLLTNCDARHPAHKAWRVARQMTLKSIGRLPGGLRDIIYISQTQLQAISPYLPSSARLHYLSNPVAVDLREERIRAEDNDIFLFVGRLAPEKGCVDFARAAKIAGVRAVFVGKGPEEETISKVNPAAELVGWVAPSDIKRWMSKARALVFPSLWYECQPLVSMEALTIGLPVIVGAWNAATEFVVNESSGFVYNESAQLAHCLQQMTPEKAAKFSVQAYANRKKIGLSLEKHVKQLMSIYELTSSER